MFIRLEHFKDPDDRMIQHHYKVFYEEASNIIRVGQHSLKPDHFNDRCNLTIGGVTCIMTKDSKKFYVIGKAKMWASNIDSRRDR